MNAEQHQTASDPWTKPTDLSYRPAFRQLWNYIHHSTQLNSSLLPSLLLSLEADTHFTISEGRRLSRPRWLVIYPDSLPAREQSPFQVVTGGTGPSWCTAEYFRQCLLQQSNPKT